MRTSEMNKLAVACHQCAGRGKILVARSLKLAREQELAPPLGMAPAPGFAWVRCAACKGEGRR